MVKRKQACRNRQYGEVTAHVFWKKKTNPPRPHQWGHRSPAQAATCVFFAFLTTDAVSVNTFLPDVGTSARRRFNSGRGHEKGAQVSKLILRYSPRPFFQRCSKKLAAHSSYQESTVIFQTIIIIAATALIVMIQLSTLGLMKKQQDDLIDVLQMFSTINLPDYQLKPSPMDSFDVTFGDMLNENTTPSTPHTGK
nr:MAG TPA: hypothetical protein [Caudoviricetes sp.]